MNEEEIINKLKLIKVNYEDALYNFEAALILNLLEEKNKKIKELEQKYNKIEKQLYDANESIEILLAEREKKDKQIKKWEERIAKGKKEVQGLKMYEMEIVCEDLQEEIKEKDKIIELMAKFIANLKLAHFVKAKDGEPIDIYEGYRLMNKEEWKKYFERKVENDSNNN